MENLLFERYTPNKNPKKLMVGIHGWKGNRFSFKPIAISLNIPDAEWIFPQAPYPIKGNEDENSWSYEISPGIWERREPKVLMDKFIENQVLKYYSSLDVYFVGFSQGALMCYEYVLHCSTPWGAVFPIAGFMTNPDDKNIYRFHPNQKNTPIIIGHGKEDDVVEFKSSELAYNHLKRKGAQVELLSYSGRHKIGISFLRKIKSTITLMSSKS